MDNNAGRDVLAKGMDELKKCRSTRLAGLRNGSGGTSSDIAGRTSPNRDECKLEEGRTKTNHNVAGGQAVGYTKAVATITEAFFRCETG
jgi:hypothetical protein